MDRRFFSENPIRGDQVVLQGPEGHHLARVLRAQPGDTVRLFDGTGREFSARVTAVRRDEVSLQITSTATIDRELAFGLHIAVALPKGDRQKWLVEKAVELGVAALIPLVTRRGVAQPVREALQRLTRQVVEASKQCGRNRLLQIEPPRSVAELCEQVPASATRLLAHPGGALDPLSALLSAAGDVVWTIGPEGGFDEEELSALIDGGFRLVDLGPRILRVETAVCACATAAAAADQHRSRRRND
jgi:16S rRNA (uracil1498-N3)-methyltransferase